MVTALPDNIEADASALDQVFTNLLSNAVKYAPNNPDINVSGQLEGGWVILSVQDQGIGIPTDELPKMFSRYFRASTSLGIAGTGIGLALVKQLVELHHGSIELESIEGEGSKFTVKLPVSDVMIKTG